MRYRKILAKRIMVVPASLLVVVTLAFVLVEAMPGDPVITIAGDFATEATVDRIRTELGLDMSRGERYRAYLANAIQGDLGTSFRTRQPVASEIARYLPNTIELAFVGLAIALLVGTLMGSVAAYFRNRGTDRVIRLVVTSLQSIPVFVLALGLIFVFYYLWRLLPAPVGRLGFTDVAPPRTTGFLLVDSILAQQWDTLASALQRMVLPAVCLGLTYAAYFAKTARAVMADTFSSQEIEFARALGLREPRVIAYALKTSRTPILTYAAILIGQLIGGATVVELVFTWQGVGLWGLEGILSLDVPVIQGFVIVTGTVTLLTYLLLDLLVIFLDPRIDYG